MDFKQLKPLFVSFRNQYNMLNQKIFKKLKKKKKEKQNETF